jgi:hypothetical protein
VLKKAAQSAAEDDVVLNNEIGIGTRVPRHCQTQGLHVWPEVAGGPGVVVDADATGPMLAESPTGGLKAS